MGTDNTLSGTGRLSMSATSIKCSEPSKKRLTITTNVKGVLRDDSTRTVHGVVTGIQRII